MNALRPAPSSFRRALLRIVMRPLALTALLAAAFLGQVAHLTATADRLDRTEVVIGRAERARSLLESAEAWRLVDPSAGHPELLRLRYEMEAQAQRSIDELAALSADDPARSRRVSQVHRAWDRSGHGARPHEEARAGGLVAPASPREAIAGFLAAEEAVRDQCSRNLRRAAAVVTLSGISLAVVLAGAVGLTARRRLATLSEAYERSVAAGRSHAEALRESEARFQTAFEHAAVGMVLTDVDGRIVSANRAFSDLTGYTEQELRALDLAALTHPDDLGASRGQVRSLLEGTVPSFAIEKRYVRKGGEIVWLQKSVSLSRDVRGEPAYVIALYQDVTERKRAEGALRDSERLTRALLDSLPSQIAVLDEAGRITNVNRSWREFAATNGAPGSAAAEGTDYLAVCDRAAAAGATEAEAFAAGIRDVLAGLRDGFAMEYSCHAPWEQRWCVGDVRRVVGEGPPRVVVTHTDVTERRQAELERRRFFSLSVDCLAIIGFDGTLRRVNPAIEQMLGLCEAELAGRSFAEFVHPDDVLASQAELEKLARGQSVGGFELRCRDAGGGYRWLSWAAVPALEEGVAYAVGRDTTERKLVEAEIRGLNAQLERRLERLAALRRIDTAITASLDTRMTLGIVLDQVLAQLQADAACVLLANPQSLSLEHAVSRGFRGEGITRARLRLGEGVAGRAALERRLIAASDPAPPADAAGRVFSAGGEEFAAYYAVPLVAKGQVRGVLEVFRREPFAPEPEWLDFLETLAGQAAIAVENGSLFEDLQRTNVELMMAYDATIEGWSRALDLRDKETEGHSQRVTDMTLRLARSMGMPDPEIVHARRGALLHDIGKMGIPDRILLKPGPLNDQEWQVMRRHPAYAFAMLSPIAFLRPALDIPYCHHEKWDGTGYPRGLKGEQIPLAARIFAAVDVWDALRSDRPYRKGWPEGRVREHLRSLSGTHLDPQVVEALLGILEAEAEAARPEAHPAWTAEPAAPRPSETAPPLALEVSPRLDEPGVAADPEPQGDGAAAGEPAASGARLTMVVADDDEGAARALQRLLTGMGHEVFVAADGEAAWRLIQENDVRVVISDWVMPGVDGLELCRRIRGRNNRPYVFVVLLTARGQSEHRLEGLRAGADDFLTKPLDPRELDARLGIARRILAMQEDLMNRSEEVDRLYAEMLRQNEHLAELVTADGLTGLKNIRGFRESLQEAFSFATRHDLPLSVVMLDVDRFKRYNDTFGHPAGDEVLCGIAAVLRENARTSDVVARYGGEEFALILPGTDADGSRALAERLRQAIAGRAWPRRGITASIGIATMDGQTLDVAEMVNLADQALYHSKRQGRNRVSHHHDLAGAAERRRESPARAG